MVLGKAAEDASCTILRAIIVSGAAKALIDLVAVVTVCFPAGSDAALDRLLVPGTPHADFPFLGFYLRAQRGLAAAAGRRRPWRGRACRRFRFVGHNGVAPFVGVCAQWQRGFCGATC